MKEKRGEVLPRNGPLVGDLVLVVLEDVVGACSEVEETTLNHPYKKKIRLAWLYLADNLVCSGVSILENRTSRISLREWGKEKEKKEENKRKMNRKKIKEKW